MADLTTNYLGLKLKNPLVASSSPLTAKPENVAQLAESGIAAVVLKSIFEEQIRDETAEMYNALEDQANLYAMEYLQADLPGRFGTEGYIARVREMRSQVDIPIICSVNCVQPDKWLSYARKLEDAGADAIELNIYHMPVNVNESSAQVEARYLKLVEGVAREVKLPLTVKLSQHVTALMPLARSLVKAGARGLVLFNRFLQTDVNIDTEELFYAPNLSTSQILHEQLRWIAVLRDWVKCDLATSGGIHTGYDLAKTLLVGSDVGYTCSALLQKGTPAISSILQELTSWMETKGYSSLKDFHGKLRETDLHDGKGFERSQYVKAATLIT